MLQIVALEPFTHREAYKRASRMLPVPCRRLHRNPQCRTHADVPSIAYGPATRALGFMDHGRGSWFGHAPNLALLGVCFKAHVMAAFCA